MTTLHDPGGKSKPKWPAGSVVNARISDDHLYRWELSEVWDATKPLVMWLMMNPSVANIEHADPTLRKTGTFARTWGYGGQLIGNIHAYRATDSKHLLHVRDPVGHGNDEAIFAMADRAEIVVLAYGQPPQALRSRAATVVKELKSRGADLRYLRLSKDGTPYHPLYLPSSSMPLGY